jgi:hypothetical protein
MDCGREQHRSGRPPYLEWKEDLLLVEEVKVLASVDECPTKRQLRNMV